MSGVSCAVVLLAAALLVAPPVGRLPMAPRRRFKVPEGWAPWWAVAPTGMAAVSLGLAVALSVALVTATLVVRRRRARRHRWCRGQGRALASALEVLVGELRIGSDPVRGFSTAAAEVVGTCAAARAVAATLGAVAARARLGADVAAGLRESGRRSSAPQDWSRISVYWQLAIDHGLPLATLMQTAHKDIAGRHQFADRLEAGLAGARATAVVLAGLPILGVLLGQLVGARPLGFLLDGGTAVLAAGVTLLCAGVTWSDRIIDRVGA